MSPFLHYCTIISLIAYCIEATVETQDTYGVVCTCFKTEWKTTICTQLPVYQVICPSETGWDLLCQYLHLDEHLLEQQNTKKLKITAICTAGG